MTNAVLNVPKPSNEPIQSYAPGTPLRTELKGMLNKLYDQEPIEIPLIIGGKEVFTGKTAVNVCPHDNKHVLCKYHQGSAEHVEAAVKASQEARKDWANMPWEARAAIFLKAADLLAGPWRSVINAATMLGQSKNPFQAEIDSACELIDFYRFNTHYMRELYTEQPSSDRGMWNYLIQRPLEGFILAVTPFNFTSIAGNLPTAPAMLGNVAIWKPASSSVYSGYYLMKLLQAAGLPDGVVNFIPGRGGEVGNPLIEHPLLAGIHFTGSTAVFQSMQRTVGTNIEKYKSYPRIVGETGGKDFIFVHPDSDHDAVAVAAVRGAFEFQGQKCSAASRMYVPKSAWGYIRDRMIEMINEIKVGDVRDFSNFVNAVIDKAAYDTITGYIDYAKNATDAKIIAGGKYTDTPGYFIHPTVIETTNPHFKTMEEEIFGPVLTVYVYEDTKWRETLDVLDGTSQYALTGAIFGRNRHDIVTMMNALENSAGNFYINDKPTGAVVGQQPFGGGRASGTNDKAGSKLNLMRWVSPRTVKENFVPPHDYKYPFLSAE